MSTQPSQQSLIKETETKMLNSDITDLTKRLEKLNTKLSELNTNKLAQSSVESKKKIIFPFNKLINKLITEIEQEIIRLTAERNVKMNELTSKKNQLMALTLKEEKFTNTSDANMFNHLLVLIVLIILILCILIYCLSDSLSGRELNF